MKHETELIRLDSVTKRYPLGSGEFYNALNGVNISITQGEFVAIMGPSGSGKSTLMHILGALDIPTSGTYFFRGKDISSYSKDELADIRNRDIGFVFQSFNLLPRTTVYKNVERPMLYGKVPEHERHQRVMDSLNLVGIASKADNLSNHISGGQIQRVAIARAIIMNPQLILADEPTGNLDTKTTHEIMGVISELNKKGRTIVVITHEDEVAKYADRVLRIVDGVIVLDKKK